jgi:hypothetical protein
MGDGYYNLKRYGQATNIYLQLIKEYPKSKEAPEADYGIISLFSGEEARCLRGSRRVFCQTVSSTSLGGSGSDSIGRLL